MGVLVRELNMFSHLGGKVEVLFQDGNVSSMNVIRLFMAMDHQAAEQNCLKATNGCLS